MGEEAPPYNPETEWRLAEQVANTIKLNTGTKEGAHGYTGGSANVSRNIDRAPRRMTGANARTRVRALLNSDSRDSFIKAVEKYS